MMISMGYQSGGPEWECSPLATLGFPEPLRTADVQYVISKLPTIEDILKKGPKKSYMAQLGCLEREGFNAALPADSNPLVLSAAFDALSEGSGTVNKSSLIAIHSFLPNTTLLGDLAAPGPATKMLQSWKQADGIEAFKKDLLVSNVRKFSAFAVFFFLIALVLDLIVESGQNAFLS
jgi:hypothetical protein